MKGDPVRHIVLRSFENREDAVGYLSILKRFNQYKGLLTIGVLSYGYGVYMSEDKTWRSLDEFI